jgi:methionine-S-sulfoxide reductase
MVANLKRLTVGSGLGVLGVAAAVFIGVQSGTISSPAVLAGGCFWGVQGVFQHVKGVAEAESGYAGGAQATADYETVSTGTTGHAESVRITYDPTQVTFGQLLQIYFSVVQDPTQLNRQGPDEGTQYRSAIFAQDATTTARRGGVPGSALQGCGVCGPDRHEGRAQHRVLRGGAVPPGLPELEPVGFTHRDQRHAQGR